MRLRSVAISSKFSNSCVMKDTRPVCTGNVSLRTSSNQENCNHISLSFIQELCYYVGVIILYFFGDLFLAIQGCGGGHDAGTVSAELLMEQLFMNIHVLFSPHLFVKISMPNTVYMESSGTPQFISTQF